MKHDVFIYVDIKQLNIIFINLDFTPTYQKYTLHRDVLKDIK